MQNFLTKQFWGYKKLSDTSMSFYHVSLPNLSDQIIAEQIEGLSYFQRQQDGSIIFHIEPYQTIEAVLNRVLILCAKQSDSYCDTQKSYYKIPLSLRQSFLSWSLAFEGCLALLLLADKTVRPYLHGSWEYINAKTGGLYLSPYTLFLYEDHPKIVHPVTIKNTKERELIEQKTAHLVKLIWKRISEAQQGLEGVALLSLVEEKTALVPSDITREINSKSFQVKVPVYSPFFSDL